MLQKIIRLLAIGIFTVFALRADAAPLPHTYHLQASDFAESSGLIFPYEPLNMIVTVTFDPLVSSGPSPVGVDSFLSPLNAAEFGPLVFRYDVSITPQLMSIGDNCLGTPVCSFTLSGEDLYFGLDFTDPSNPIFSSMVIRTTGTRPTGGTGQGDFRPATRTICEVDVNCVSTVPEPATVLLIAIGVAGLAATGRRKRWMFAEAARPEQPIS